MWPFKTAKQIRGQWALSQALLNWSKSDPWTIGNAVEGTLILGSTGSGKSSASGKTIAKSFLAAGFGGLVLTAKSGERQVWEDYCRQTGRGKDLIVFGPDSPWRFNFLDYEFSRPGDGAGQTENIVNLFGVVLEIAERGSGSGGGGRDEEGYWKRANRQLLRNLVDLLSMATGRVSVPDLYRLVVSAPQSFAQIGSVEWQRSSFCWQCLKAADGKRKTAEQGRDFGLVSDFFLLEFPGLSDKTRSVIVSTFTSMADVLNRGLLRKLFCSETNLTPQATEQGKIILLDFPVKEFGEVGQIAQVLFKFAFQKAVERRDVTVSPRPVFLFQDEAQYFTTAYDAMFQSTCRSARIATVILSQNLSNFIAAMGAENKGKSLTDGLFGNLNTKIFHANADAQTNEWASTMIGKSRQFFMNAGQSQPEGDWLSMYGSDNGQGQSSSGMSEQIDFELQPAELTRLRTGGPAHRYQVEAVVFGGGRTYQSSGRTWMKVGFDQRA